MKKYYVIMYFISFLHTINIFLEVDKTCFVHKYILVIQLDVMDNFCDEQIKHGM